MTLCNLARHLLLVMFVIATPSAVTAQNSGADPFFDALVLEEEKDEENEEENGFIRVPAPRPAPAPVITPKPSLPEPTPRDSSGSASKTIPAFAQPVRPDPELQRRLAAYREKFVPLELAARARRDSRLNYLRTEFTGTDEERLKEYNKTIRQYNRHSWVLVQKFRKPVQDRVFELVNERVPDDQKIYQSLGRGAIVQDENGRDRRNADFTAASDLDAAIGPKGQSALGQIIKANGMYMTNNGNSSDIFIDRPDPNAPFQPNRLNQSGGFAPPGPDLFQMTVNINAVDEFDDKGKRIKAGIGDTVGSSAQSAQMSADAENVERFTHISQKDGDAKSAVFHHSLRRKSLELSANFNPERAFDPGNEDRLQMSAKSALKMMDKGGTLTDHKISEIMQRIGLDGTPEDFRSQVKRIYNREPGPDVVKQDRAKFVIALDAVQDEGIRIADDRADVDIRNQEEVLSKLQNQLERNVSHDGRKLNDGERQGLIADIAARKQALVDAKERLRAAREVTRGMGQMADARRDTGNGGSNSVGEVGENANRPSPGSPAPMLDGTPVQVSITDLPTTNEIARQNVSNVGDTITSLRESVSNLPQGNERAMRGYTHAGKVMGVYGDYVLVKEVIKAWAEDDHDKLTQLAWDELRDQLKFRAAEALVPGSGQLMMAYYIGEAVGGIAGANVRIGSGGPTINQAAESMIEAAYDIVSGNQTTRWERERVQSYRDYMLEFMTKEVKDKNGKIIRVPDPHYKLPDGITAENAFNYAMQKTRQGGDFYATIDQLFERTRTEEQQLAALAKEEQEILASLPDPDETPKPKSEKKTTYSFDNQDSDDSALQAFRANRAKEKEIANQASDASGGSSLNQAFAVGDAAQQDHQRQLDEIERKKIKLRQIQERTRLKREKRLREEAANQQEIRDLANAFSKGLNQVQITPAYRREPLVSPLSGSGTTTSSSGSSTGSSRSSNWQVQLPPAYVPPQPRAAPVMPRGTSNPYGLGQLPTMLPTSSPKTNKRNTAANAAFANKQCTCYNLGKSIASGKGNCGGAGDIAKSNKCQIGFMGSLGAFDHGCIDGRRSETVYQSRYCK